MLYVRGRLLFIHIPRSSGMSVSSTLTKHLIDSDPCASVLYSTGLTPPFHQHSTARELRPLIPDWDNIHKFAIYRDEPEIIASDYRLHRNAANHVRVGEEPGFVESIQAAAGETVEQFAERRWKPWTVNRSPWLHWTEGWRDIHRYEFADLENEWIRLLSDLGLPLIDLVHCNASR